VFGHTFSIQAIVKVCPVLPPSSLEILRRVQLIAWAVNVATHRTRRFAASR